MTFEALILSGGFGTRLQSAVPDLPKVLAPIAGRPFLAYLMEALADAGAVRFVLAVGYKRDLIIEHIGFEFAGAPVVYSVENTPLGTGGAARKALEQVRSPDAVVLNGDTWLAIDFSMMVESHRRAGAKATLAVVEVAEVGRYGAVEVRDGRVARLVEKGRSGAGLINAGAYVLDRTVFASYSLPSVFSLEQDFLVPHLSTLSPLAFLAKGTFIDIGLPEDYVRARMLLGGSSKGRDVS